MDPIPGWARKLWDAWDARIMISLSLIFQIILFIFGSSRKCTKSIQIRILVWLAYLLADWVATVALGKLSYSGGYINNIGATPNNRVPEVRILWAPLLLLHLGGPDTITAFALEDNQLWLRHLLGLGVQVVVAIYVILKFWEIQWFTFLSFPIFMSGIIKYGERTWALKSASGSQQKIPMGGSRIANSPDVETTPLVWAHQYLRIFKPHIASYVFTTKDIWDAAHLLQLGKPDVSLQWRTMEVEMGLMYDMLYTKAAIIYTRRGFTIRCITFLSTLLSLVGFLLVIFLGPKLPRRYGRYNFYYYRYNIDIVISGVLLVGAFVLEIYGVVMELSSDWTKLWLIKHQRIQTALRLKNCWLFRKEKRRWCGKMGQLSLLSFCLHGKHDKWVILSRILSCFGIEEDFDKYLHKTLVDVPPDVKKGIIEFLFKETTAPIIDGRSLQVNLLWGEQNRDWVKKKGIEQRMIIWHLATELCYHLESKPPNASDAKRKTCKYLSDYMMYLTVACPSLLPVPTYTTDATLKPTIKELKRHLKRDRVGDMGRACQDFKRIFGDKGDDGANNELELARAAGDLAEFLERKEDKWEILYSVWLDMLCYAASGSLRNNHAVHLAEGGELITLVWLLTTQSDIQDIAGKAAELR